MADILGNLCAADFTERRNAAHILDVLHGTKALLYHGTNEAATLASERAAGWRDLCMKRMKGQPLG